MMVGCPRCAASQRSFIAAFAMATSGNDEATGSQPTSRPRASEDSFDRVIDFHAHILEPLLIPEGGEPSLRGRDGWPERLTDPLAQIADMQRIGVDCHVVGQSNVIQGISWGSPKTDLDIHRRINDGIAERWVSAHPGRFKGAFGLPTQDIDLAIAELERAVTLLDLHVLQISSCTPDGIYYGDPRLHPLWEAIRHFGVTVFIHPHGQQNLTPLNEFALQNSVGQSIEEAKVMSSIIHQGIFDKFHGIKIVMAHGGGFLPHYYGRVDRNVTNFPISAVNISKLPSEYLREFYYDSCVYSPDVMAALIKVVGVDRIVLGGDYPVGLSDPVAALHATPLLSKQDVEKIICHTPNFLLSQTIQ
jgi:aminocarboxymuconate-semialdehyde decarboxylase